MNTSKLFGPRQERSDKAPIKRIIKISTPFPEWPLLRQTPGSKGVWQNCNFVENRQIDECDAWVVYEGLSNVERTSCSPENTILITAEPPSVKSYKPGFLRQFGKIITCHRGIRQRGVIHGQQALPWHIGACYLKNQTLSFQKNYDDLKAVKEFHKERLTSIISSNKEYTEGHKKRLHFVKRLSDYFGPQIDFFGRGFHQIPDKWDAIAPYKYHIALENSVCQDYWTEKLSDAFLGLSFPFYYGCPNVSEYFPFDAYKQIDINDVEGAIVTIKTAIENQQYEKSLPALLKAKDMVLNKYNLFPMIADIMENDDCNRKKTVIELRPETCFTESILGKVLRQIRSRL